MPPRNILIIVVTIVISILCYQKAPRSREARSFVDAINIISDNYVEPVTKEQLFEQAMNGMVSQLDPYSSYIPPSSYARFKEAIDQEFGGIGILVEGPPTNEQLTVVSPLVGTPAFEAGIQAGDVVLSIDDTSTEKMLLEDAVPLMRGKPGTTVDLVIRRPGVEQPLNFTVARDDIQRESVYGDRRKSDGSWSFHLAEDPQIGYIHLESFGEHTVEELSRALRFNDRPVRAFIVDLRDNAGGLLTSAVDTCDMFIESGLIVRTMGRGGVSRDQYSAKPGIQVDASIPMAVIVNRFSASAAEIVSACLKDHGRAIVVGQRSWGKGSVQNIIEMEGRESALKLTTATYWRPSGKNIHRRALEYDEQDEDEWGVKPTDGYAVSLTDEQEQDRARYRRDRYIILPASSAGDDETPGEEEKVGTEIDPQLKMAVDYLREQLQTKAKPTEAAQL